MGLLGRLCPGLLLLLLLALPLLYRGATKPREPTTPARPGSGDRPPHDRPPVPPPPPAKPPRSRSRARARAPTPPPDRDPPPEPELRRDLSPDAAARLGRAASPAATPERATNASGSGARWAAAPQLRRRDNASCLAIEDYLYWELQQWQEDWEVLVGHKKLTTTAPYSLFGRGKFKASEPFQTPGSGTAFRDNYATADTFNIKGLGLKKVWGMCCGTEGG